MDSYGGIKTFAKAISKVKIILNAQKADLFFISHWLRLYIIISPIDNSCSPLTPKGWFEYNGDNDQIALHNFSENFVVKFQNASKPSGGNWLANSDTRLKKNIRSLDSQDMLEKVKRMRGVSYEWDDNITEYGRHTGKQIGFIAQELQKNMA